MQRKINYYKRTYSIYNLTEKLEKKYSDNKILSDPIYKALIEKAKCFEMDNECLEEKNLRLRIKLDPKTPR